MFKNKLIFKAAILSITALMVTTLRAGARQFDSGPFAGQPTVTVLTASDSWNVGPGDYITDSGIPACGTNNVNWLDAAEQAIAASQADGAAGYYGPLISVLNTVAQFVRPQTRGFIGQALDAIYGGHRYANCVVESVVLPAGAQIVGYQFEASDWTGSRLCFEGQDCQIGWSRFDPPQTTNAGNQVIVTSVFRNWSGDRQRQAIFRVFFKQP